MMSHPIVHIELSSINHKEAAKFYADVFGWEMSDFAEMHYTTFLSGENAPGGGFNDVQEGNPAGTTVVYIHTDSIEDSVVKIEASGGKMLTPPIDIPGVGTMQHFSDPTGNRMSLLKPTESSE
jgi:predicted enzyme related to lactoylglutathione lyase